MGPLLQSALDGTFSLRVDGRTATLNRPAPGRALSAVFSRNAPFSPTPLLITPSPLLSALASDEAQADAEAPAGDAPSAPSESPPASRQPRLRPLAVRLEADTNASPLLCSLPGCKRLATDSKYCGAEHQRVHEGVLSGRVMELGVVGSDGAALEASGRDATTIDVTPPSPNRDGDVIDVASTGVADDFDEVLGPPSPSHVGEPPGPARACRLCGAAFSLQSQGRSLSAQELSLCEGCDAAASIQELLSNDDEDDQAPVLLLSSSDDEDDQAPGAEGAPSFGLCSALASLPAGAPEQPAVDRLDAARRQELPHLSRRRALPESEGALLDEPFPAPHAPCPTDTPAPDEPSQRAPPRRRKGDVGGVRLPARDMERAGVGQAQLSATRSGLDAQDLLNPGVYERISEWVREASAAFSGGDPPADLVISEEEAFRPFARGATWDVREAGNARRLRREPSMPRGASSLNASFIRSVAEELGWEDRDLLWQVDGGAEDRSECGRDIVLCFHHSGLQKNLGDAIAAVDDDVRAGFIETGFAFPPILPIRLPPRNIAVQQRWVPMPDGSLGRKRKARFTTDDSWDSGGRVASRNAGIDHDTWPRQRLPSARDLARAAAILQIGAAKAGVPLLAYARDLTAAYRQWGVCPPSLRFQGFAWLDGVALDQRLEFGTASAVQLFERLSSLLVAYALLRCRRFDAANPPRSEVLRRWLRRRSRLGAEQAALVYLHVYIDVRRLGPAHHSRRHARRARRLLRLAGLQRRLYQ